MMYSNVPQQEVYTKIGDNSYESILVGILSYEGHVPTFVAKLHNEALYHYIPVHHLSTNGTFEGQLQDAYSNCPDTSIEVYTLPFTYVSLFDRDRQYRGVAKYFFTVEWPRANQNLHFLLHANRFYLWPNHKVLFGQGYTLPVLPKIREEYKL